MTEKPVEPFVTNRKVFHDYFIEDRLEAGLQLMGWEVKAVRAHRANINDAHVLLKQGELFVLGMHITPLLSASTHIEADPTRTRKLLLHQEEISKLIGKVERAGYALIPLNLHETRGRVKLTVGLAKGKKQFDKREVQKQRDWQMEKSQLLRQRNKA